MTKRPSGKSSRFEVSDVMGLVGRHDVTIEETELDRAFVVRCSCGLVAPAPFGAEHAARITERHLALYGLAPDPQGARYRT
jgi:hypothetical protein